MGGLESGSGQGPKIQQGEAGFLTEAQLAELESTPAKATQIESTPEPAAEAPAAPLTPERKEAVLEQIGQQEVRLEANVSRNQELLSAADAKFNDPVAQKTNTPSKELLTLRTIDYARARASERINELSIEFGSVAILGTMLTGMGVGEIGLNMDTVLANRDAVIAAGRHIMEGGVAVAGVVAAAWVISKTINWLNFRSKKEKLKNGEPVYE